MTIAITIDRRWCGLYIGRGYSLRIALGFIAFDVFRESLDLQLQKLFDKIPEDVNETKPYPAKTQEAKD